MLRYTSDNIGEIIKFKTLYVGANVVIFIFIFYKRGINGGKPRLSISFKGRKNSQNQILLI